MACFPQQAGALVLQAEQAEEGMWRRLTVGDQVPVGVGKAREGQ